MRGLGLLAAATLVAGAAEAATVKFGIAAACVTDCAAVGAFPGDDAGGSVTLDASGFTPGGAIAPSDFLAFTFLFGGIDLGRNTAPAYGVSGVWGATPDDPKIGLSINMGAVAPGVGRGLSLSVNMPGQPSRFLGTFDGVCTASAGSACATLSVGPQGSAIAPEPVVKYVPAPVPVPPALGLMLLGLAALGLAGRRRGRAQAAASSG
jgi:hypothetical protein